MQGVVSTVAFKVYDMDNDGFISNSELFQTLKLMVGNNLKDTELQQIVDKTILAGDRDGDGKLSFQEFCAVRLYVHTHSWFCYSRVHLSDEVRRPLIFTARRYASAVYAMTPSACVCVCVSLSVHMSVKGVPKAV